MAGLIFVVHADPGTLKGLEALLSQHAFTVAAIDSFARAKEHLNAVSPDLLIVDVKLGPFNGLHLVVRSSLDHPNLPAIVTHDQPDPVIESEARRLHADFIVKPLENPAFMPAVLAAVDRYR